MGGIPGAGAGNTPSTLFDPELMGSDAATDEPPEERQSSALAPGQTLNSQQVYAALKEFYAHSPLANEADKGSTAASPSTLGTASTAAVLGEPRLAQGPTAHSADLKRNALDQALHSYQETYNKTYTAAKRHGETDAGAASLASAAARPYQQKLEAGDEHYGAAEKGAYRESWDAAYKAAKDSKKSDPEAVTDATAAASSAADQIGLLDRLRTQIAATHDPGKQEPLKQAYKDMTDALISKDVYNDKSINGALPPGVSRVDDPQELAKLGLKQSDLQDPKSGLFSAVYHDKNTNTYIIANRGTSKGKDAIDDYAQAEGFTGLATQYKNAVAVAMKVKDAQAKGSFSGNVEFTGHSLGGGLAAAQALRTGLPAETFDAAGLSDQTIADLGLNRSNEKNITAISNGDILTQLQTHPLAVSAGGVLFPPLRPLVRQPPPPAAGVQKPLTSVFLPTRNQDGSIEQGKPMSGREMVTNTVALHGLDYNISAIAYHAAQISAGR